MSGPDIEVDKLLEELSKKQMEELLEQIQDTLKKQRDDLEDNG